MLELKIINIDNREVWEEIADETAEIYDRWQYVSAFYKNGDGIPYISYLKGKNGVIYNVYIRRKIEVDKYNNLYDIITPYGYGGVKIKGNITQEEKEMFFNEFEKYCKENNIISEFIRLNPLENNYSIYDAKKYNIIRFSTTIYIKLESEEQIWQDMKSNCRNKIRKAINNNIEIRSGFNEKMMEEFKIVYEETMNRDNANDYYYFKSSFFDDILLNMKNNAIIYTAYLENKPINSILVIYSGENAHYHLSGTLSNYMNLGVNNFTLYKIALDMLKKGYKNFHLGGGYGGDHSPLLEFKKSFNKNGELDFYIGKKIFNNEKYKELVEINKMNKEDFDENSQFFPLYRA